MKSYVRDPQMTITEADDSRGYWSWFRGEALDPEHTRSFRDWQMRFIYRLNDGNFPGVAQAWERVVSASCDDVDLDWLLHFAIVCIAASRHLTAMQHRFKKDCAAIPEDIIHLRQRLNVIRLATSEDLALCLKTAVFSRSEVAMMRSLEGLLKNSEKLLNMKFSHLAKANLKTVRAAIGNIGEVWLHSYVMGSTRRHFYSELSCLLENAADVYGIDARGFDSGAVIQRYTRFRHQNPEKARKLLNDVKDFWRERIERFPQKIDFLPFISEREKDSFLEDYV
jgi:hypothetical protein